MEGTIGSSDGMIQIQQNRPSVVPSAPYDPTGHRCIALVYYLGFKVQWLFWLVLVTG
jgi:hypothetical protein